MPLIGEHYVIDVIMGSGAQNSSCRLYAGQTAGSTMTQAALQTFANTLFTTLTVSLEPVLAGQAEFRQIYMKLAGGSDELEAYSTNSPIAGGAAGDMFPEEVAVVIQRRTGKPGRNKRGRIFLPFVPEEFAVDSTLTATAVGLYKTLATALKTPFVSGGITLSPLTPDFKNSILEPVIQTRVLSEVMSRRQRRFPKKPLPLTP